MYQQFCEISQGGIYARIGDSAYGKPEPSVIFTYAKCLKGYQRYVGVFQQPVSDVMIVLQDAAVW